MYRIKYVYLEPGRAGPYRGSMLSADKHAKDDTIYAVFGKARVVSCSKVRQPQEQST